MTGTMTRREAPLGFLSDVQRPPAMGAAALREAAALLAGSRPQDLFRACNLLALVHFRTGSAHRARRLCLDQIACALAHRGRPRWPRLAALALQPQINLIRLKGYAPDRVDEALRDLAALEPLTFGRGVRLPDLSFGEDTARQLTESAGLDLDLVRNVLVHDTCGILWRHRLDDRLLAEAARLAALWPESPAHTRVQHAAEAPWLVDALARPEVPATALDGARNAAGRLAYVRLLHVADHAAQAGQRDRATRLVETLSANRAALAGPFASPLTPLRWLGSLARTAERLQRPDLAHGLLRELAGRPELPADRALHRLVRQGLGDREPPRTPDGAAAPPGGAAAPPTVEELTEEAEDRLAALAAAR
ncbi:hypothetical protein [Streptomyces hoynatensis]|uniref:hypothetical protein n=1 Tax=Streptomyces hoynatensis TaxID=1141874 RepID=UPI0011C4705F|nr:hypothetical protein [Streptomyces hoynatensis]